MKTDDKLVWFLAITGTVGCVMLAFALYRADATRAEIFSAAGSLASFVGLVIVAIQLRGVRTATRAAADAAEATRSSVQRLSNLADVTKTIKLIEQVQTDAGAGNYELARARLQDVRSNLILFEPAVARLGENDNATYVRLVGNTSIDLANLYNAVHGQGKKINAAKFASGLEELIPLLLRAERLLKTEE
jgi:hypothetical protein